MENKRRRERETGREERKIRREKEERMADALAPEERGGEKGRKREVLITQAHPKKKEG